MQYNVKKKWGAYNSRGVLLGLIRYYRSGCYVGISRVKVVVIMIGLYLFASFRHMLGSIRMIRKKHSQLCVQEIGAVVPLVETRD